MYVKHQLKPWALTWWPYQSPLLWSGRQESQPTLRKGPQGQENKGLEPFSEELGKGYKITCCIFFKLRTSPLVSPQTCRLHNNHCLPMRENYFYQKKGLHLHLLFRWYLCLTVASSCFSLSRVSSSLAYMSRKEKTELIL